MEDRMTKMSYTIRYNGQTNHIEGMSERTAPGADNSDATGVVSYYAQSACASLTRSGSRMAVGASFETASEALAAAEASSAATGRKLCKNCVKAAKWAITYEFDAESEEFKAEKKRVNDELIAQSEATRPVLAPAIHNARTVQIKSAPFTFEYDATAGTLIAAALREKAKTHRDAAKGYRTNAGLGTQLQDFYIGQARIQDNNAQLLEDAADAIHGPVKASLTEDMGRAIDRADKPFHGQVKDAIGLKW